MTDLTILRRQFPALQREHGGHPIAYFDGPGGTQVPASVAAAMSRYLLGHNANQGWAFPTSEETDQVVAGARQAMADYLGALPGEIAFGQNMTSLTFHVSRALGRLWQPGDEIVVTELDHHANVDPWKQLAQDRGLVIRTARMSVETGTLDWPHLESLMNSRTKLVAIGASSNALGTINDVGRAVRLAHAVGALCFVDAVHYAPHHLIDVRAWDCDLLACSAYKFYGPHTGVLFLKQSLVERLPTPKLEPAHSHGPARFETGTPSFESLDGTRAAVDFLASLGDGATRRERLGSALAGLHHASSALFEHLWQGLKANSRVRLYGPLPGEHRAPTVSFTVDGETAREVAQRLARAGVFVSHGNFYALTVIRRLGCEAEGVVRVGLSCYNTAEEVDRLLEELAMDANLDVVAR